MSTSAPCPHCGAHHDISHHVSGTRVWCTICDGWFLVRFVPGGAALTPCEPPATWPKTKKGQ